MRLSGGVGSSRAESTGLQRRRWWDAVRVIFGDALRPAASAAPAEWIAPARRGPMGTVGALVPNSYSSLLRIHPPPSIPGDWWATYRDLYAVVAEVGARHTTTVDRTWFAVWEGHGFDNAEARLAWPDPAVDEAERQQREIARAQLRDDYRRRNAAISAGLRVIPLVDLPDRTYYLMEGPVGAVAGLRDPASGQWRNPDLFWPDDRRWFVATDVDFWSLYVGGDNDLVADLVASVTTPTEAVTLSYQLELED